MFAVRLTSIYINDYKYEISFTQLTYGHVTTLGYIS